MKMNFKNILFLLTILVVGAIYAGCTKGPNIKSYNYPAPVPQGMFPDSGYAGFAEVTIDGSQFGDYKNAVKVFFNGIPADSVLSCEDSKIVVRVPANAVSGKVGLQVWTNTVDSVGSFTVKPYPAITSVSDSAGIPGDVIMISGTNFGSDLSKVSISFNGTSGTVNSVNDSLVSITVPASFKPGNLTLTVNDFVVTGPGFGILVAIPSPVYALDFENDLVDRISGVAATYSKGTADTLAYVSGQRGLAVKFPGYTPTSWSYGNGTVSIPTTVVKQKEFTVTCWVNWATGRNIYPDCLFEFGEVRGTRIGFLTRMGSAANSWNGSASRMVGRYLLTSKVPVGGPYVNTDEYVIGSTVPVLPANTWKHVAFVFSYSNQSMKLYMDGVLTGTKTFSRTDEDPFLMTINRAVVGGYAYGSGTETNYAGLMDNFRIYDQALSADQIYTDYYKK